MVTLSFNISDKCFDELADLKESMGCIVSKFDDMTFNEFAAYLLDREMKSLMRSSNGKQ